MNAVNHSLNDATAYYANTADDKDDNDGDEDYDTDKNANDQH